MLVRRYPEKVPGLLLSCLPLLLALGCTSSDAVVNGTVTFDKKPLPAGRITFVCDGGDKPVISSEIRSGAYTIPVAPAGSATVMVETFAPVAYTPVPGAPPVTGAPAAAGPGGGPSAAPPPIGEYVAIPDRYLRLETSGLKYEIKPGAQVINVDLTP
jgi:hypothetical protein